MQEMVFHLLSVSVVSTKWTKPTNSDFSVNVQMLRCVDILTLNR